MSTRLFIVRHAEHVKPGDDHLSKIGSLQAAALAETFKGSKTKFDAIYASSRCKETAERIAAALGLTVTTDERLRNWNGGVIQGLTKDEVRIKHPDVYELRYVNRDPMYVVPEGESLKQRYDRVDEFLHSVVATGPSPSAEPKQIIVVTHGGIIDDMFRIACKLPVPEKIGLKKPFGCVSALLHENGNWRDEEWARADHLPRVVAESPSGGHLYLFPNQVSGSFPMLRGDRGELCKPATSNELSCYTAIFASSASPEIARLRECVPKFLGTVDVDITSFLQETPVDPNSTSRAQGSLAASARKSELSASPNEISSVDASSVASAGGESVTGTSPETNDSRHSVGPGEMRRTSTASSLVNPALNPRRSFSMSNLWSRFVTDRWQKLVRSGEKSNRRVYLILENVTHGLVNPNIMDVKLGTRQHRDTETEEKQKRKAARCKDSTSATLGLRIHGISMYSITEQKIVMRDKYWGRILDDQAVLKALQEFIDAPVADPRYVVAQIVKRLELIRDCVQGVTWRFYGSSILIVFDSQVEKPEVHVRLIDFGSCDMNTSGALPGFDDGFVFGMRNLIEGFKTGLKEICKKRGLEPDLGELNDALPVDDDNSNATKATATGENDESSTVESARPNASSSLLETTTTEL